MVRDSGQILKTGPIGFFEELYVKHERKRGFKGGSRIFGPNNQVFPLTGMENGINYDF